MRALITGAAGHLGEALARTLAARGDEVVGLDRLASPFVTHLGDVADFTLAAQAMSGVEVVFHAATLHKPHIASHTRQSFIDINITGTNVLLEAAARAKLRAFVFTSTTSVFGDTMDPAPGAPAVWVDETLPPKPRNIYGVSKLAAEALCGLARRDYGLATIILRTSRFFPEEDDDPRVAAASPPDNVKLNEFLYRRADIEDVVGAHVLAMERAQDAGPGPYIISATTPFESEDLADLVRDAPAALARRVPEYSSVYEQLGWRMFQTLGRVYDNSAARRALGWIPNHDFRSMLGLAAQRRPPASDLALMVGAKGYHRES